MKGIAISPQSLLSSLWVFILFNMIFRDLHQFLNEGFIDGLTTSNLSEEIILVFGFVLEIPILMALLSKLLKDETNKWANIIAVCITSLGIFYSLASADLDDIFFGAMELAALLAILRTALKLKTPITSKI